MGILLEGLLFSPTEWALILGVVLLMFGGKKIPEVMKGLGSGIKEFKHAMNDNEEESKPSNTPATPLPVNTPENSKESMASGSSAPNNTEGN